MCGGCMLTLLAILLPRAVLVAIWLTTDWFAMAYETWFWPVAGWIFMPYTTAAYMAAMLRNEGHVSGGWLALVVVAVLADLGSHGSGGAQYRARLTVWRRRRLGGAPAIRDV